MDKFAEMMHPNHRNAHSFTYPRDHLLRLRGTIPEEEKRHPTSLGSKSGAFTDRGDSGAVIVDRQGRIGSLLTSGAGITDSTEITYATPISFLLKCIQNKGLRSPNISPVLRKEA